MTERLAKEIKQSRPFVSSAQELYFNLIRSADVLSRLVEDLLKPHDLSQVQYNVLRILRGAGDDGLPCHEIGARLLTHDPDVTRLVDRLERRALVSRGRDHADRRVVLVRIATAGLELIAQLDLDRRVDTALAPRLAGLNASERTTLITLLERLRD
jgi:DNA-binding MarR family transcriptional regulator